MAIEILRKLPIRSIMRCKCVCKSWRNHFKRSYTPEPCLAVVNRDKLFPVCDEEYEPLFGFNLPPFYHAHNRVVIDSANGLIFLRDGCANTLFICNPLTREYAELPHLPSRTHSCTFGFGVSKLTGQYKIEEKGCGEASQRHHHMKGLFGYDFEENFRSCCFLNLRAPGDYAVFFNGNLHWLEFDSENNLFVSCFDLEAELFTKFSLPDYDGSKHDHYQLCYGESAMFLRYHME
ncbi:F-box protein At5g49610-like [Salvia splendens]|uniref:F-box protein At5g49610-like n=1 Tax=Salvia splendens TaxID=180675 RepID=UPI001C25ED53|nr:F-box protein At5g49610-like [Salvia splendens]